MTHSSLPLNHDQNLKRFKKACIVFLSSGFLLFLISLSFYSPNADHFSVRFSLFALSIIGILLGSAVALIGTIVSAILIVPYIFTPSKDVSLGTLDSEPTFTRNKEDTHSYDLYRQRSDWDNDYANFASPIHQVIERSHHHD